MPPPAIVASNSIIPLNENSPKKDEALGGMDLEAVCLVQAYLLATCPGRVTRPAITTPRVVSAAGILQTHRCKTPFAKGCA